MGVNVTTTYRYQCDRCGNGPEETSMYLTQESARSSAKGRGFLFSEWLLEGKAPRQTCFCPSCVAFLMKEEAKNLVKG